MAQNRCFLLHLIVVLVGIFTAFHPTLLSSGRFVQTDPGDTLLNHYVLEHSWKWLSDSNYSAPLWSPAFFFPTSSTLAYSENLLGTAPLYWLFRPVVDETVAFQFWMITVSALTYLAMAWVLTRFEIDKYLAALGAFVFAFGMGRVSQLSHQQLLPAMFSPFAVYYLVQLFKVWNSRTLCFLLLFTFLQMAASIYLGWFLVFGMCVFVINHWVLSYLSRVGFRNRPVDSVCTPVREASLMASLWFSLACVVLILCAVLLLWPYILANQTFHRSYSEVRLMLPTIGSWTSPPPASLWATVFSSLSGPASHEHHLFPGAALIVLTMIAVFMAVLRPSRLSLTTWTMLLTGLVLILVSLQFDRISAWRIVYRYVPGAQGIRAVTRIFIVVSLFWWIGVLLMLSQWRTVQSRWATVGLLTLLLIGMAEHWHPNLPAFDPRPFFEETDRLAEQMRNADVVYVEPDVHSAIWVNELSAMWAGLKANVPVVNGYSGRQPTGYPTAITGPDDLAKWVGNCQNVRVIGPARLAHAYPMPIEHYRPAPYLQAHRGD